MSYTDGMDKTPGQRQHNRGWAKLARTARREEAVARKNGAAAPSPGEKLLTEIFTEQSA